MQRIIDGYICDEHGSRKVFYPCDPEKNTTCNKRSCAYRRSDGDCSITRDRAAARDGAKPFYIKLQRDTFVREYIVGSDGSAFDSDTCLRSFEIWCTERRDRHSHWTKRDTIEIVASIVSGICGSLLVLKLFGVF